MVSLFFASVAWGDESAARQCLRYIYGASGVDVTNAFHLSPDLWMLRGATNPAALAKVDALKIEAKSTGVVYGTVDLDMFLIETRDGRVDPTFNLEQIYQRHRQLILNFLVYAFMRETAMTRRLVTDPANVEVLGPKPARGEFEQYASIIGMTPAVRSSRPEDDVKTRTVTYRVPLGDRVIPFTLVKQGSTWKIDTSGSLQLSFNYLFR